MNKKEEKAQQDRVIPRDVRRWKEELSEEEIRRELEQVKAWARGGMSLIEMEEELDYLA